MHRLRPALAALFVLVATLVVGVPRSVRAEVSVGSCPFPLHADPDLLNIAYPDQSAQYWLGEVAVPPGTTATISGSFPRARYFSFNAYEGSMPVDAIADYEIRARTGVNPFVTGVNRASAGTPKAGTYSIKVVGGPRPAAKARAANTLYAGQGQNGEPQAAAFILYRVYLGVPNSQGGVALPTISYARAASATTSIPACQQLQPATGGALNDEVQSQSAPYNSSASTVTRPVWGVSQSSATARTIGPVSVYSSSPFFPNIDNVYLSLEVTRNTGDVVAVRLFPPTVPDDTAPVMRTSQLRYWSLCTNDFPTTRYVACLADKAARRGSEGYVTIVISDPAHKPHHLRPGDNWLPAGPYPDIFLLYRNMLPSNSFTHAVQDVPAGSPPAKTMGAYYPQAYVCTTARFDQDRCGMS
jgi:hypothetical protein